LRNRTFIRLLAVVAVLGLLAAACSKKSNDNSGGGGGSKTAVKIAYVGALSGDYKLLVVPGEQAAQLAFDQANAAGDLPVTITLVPEDTQGDPAQAPAVADKITSDDAMVGVIGPAFSGESQAAGTKLDPAGIPFMTPSATNPPLADNGWTHWFRAVGNDNSQGPVGAAYIEKVLKPNCTFMASDGSAYGKGLADVVQQTLTTDGAEVEKQQTVQPGQKDYSALVSKIKSSGCTAVFYGGYSPEAGLIRKQMSGAGLNDVTFLGGDGIKDDTFTGTAGSAGDGTIATCPCASITDSTDPAAQKFVSDFTAKYGSPPGIYAGEGWDIAQMYIAAFKAGKTTRQAITDYFHGLSGYKGLTKSYTFQSNGELDDSSVTIYVYKDDGGTWTYLGPATDVIS
jgi:branched-chain amino acid transport system substrate-binding protein